MNRTRRKFLADVGRGMLVANVGTAVATDLELIPRAFADEPTTGRLSFGKLEPLVGLMQDTPADKLLPVVVKKLHDGTSLRELVAAGALANARQFGGEDYVGWHTFMALAPAFEMSKELPDSRRALPVLKVLHRNSRTIQGRGGARTEVLKPVDPRSLTAARAGQDSLREAIGNTDTAAADAALVAIARREPDEAYHDLEPLVEESVFPNAGGIHGSVLAWRAWSTLDLTGKEHAETLLRQSVHYCVEMERQLAKAKVPAMHKLLPHLLEQYKLTDGAPGGRRPDDDWIAKFAQTINDSNSAAASEAVAAALADRIDPAAVGEALALAANHLLLCDAGRPRLSGNKAPMSVHGDSAGIHASDAVNAWRNIARVSNPRNAAAGLIVAAQCVNSGVGDNSRVGKEQYYPFAKHLEMVSGMDAAALVGETERAIRAGDQGLACAAVQHYGELGGAPRAMFDLMLKYAISEDGALHAEKYYRTASEEFAAARPAFRWRQLVALARVTASEYGQPAPGYDEACHLLQL